MLIRFKVSNFLSFYEEQTFSMIAGATKKKEEHLIDEDNLKLLKFSAIYGANASGKSNLLKAIDLSKSIILRGIFANFNNLYCRINAKNAQENSSFEFEIKLKDKFYAYGFDILLSQNSIKGEWLYEIDKKKNKDVLIYTRELNKDITINEEYFDNNREIVDRLYLYASDIKNQDNILLLTIMNKNKETLYNENSNNKIVILKELFSWFAQSLTIITPQRTVDNSLYFLSEENIEKISDIIGTFGTGIKKCRYEKSSMDEISGKVRPPEVLKDISNTLEMTYLKNVKDNPNFKVAQGILRLNREMYVLKKTQDPEINVLKIVLEHKNDESFYSFNEESDGTQRLFDLIEVLLNQNKEKVYFIDEIDRCLHPQLTYKFIKTFLNKEDKNNQLVVTTHESRLLNFDLLRRDEIWFANRKKYGPTELYSLEEYNERFDKKIDKAYLEGRYGGVPIFETLFPIGDDNS